MSDTRNVAIAHEHAERVADWLLAIRDPDERELVQEIYERKLNDRLYRGSLDMHAAADGLLADTVGLFDLATSIGRAQFGYTGPGGL